MARSKHYVANNKIKFQVKDTWSYQRSARYWNCKYYRY